MSQRRPPQDLTGKQRRQLRALGHHLHPTVMIGKEGGSDALLGRVTQELEAHELIKIRILENAPEAVKRLAPLIAEQSGAHVAQILGNTALLYRQRGTDPTIELAQRAGPPYQKP